MLADRGGQVIEAGSQTVGERVEDAGRQRLGGQIVERADPDDVEHGGYRVGIRSDMAIGKGGLGVIRHGVAPDSGGRSRQRRPLPLSSTQNRAPERFGLTAFPHGRATARSPLSRGIVATRGPGA